MLNGIEIGQVPAFIGYEKPVKRTKLDIVLAERPSYLIREQKTLPYGEKDFELTFINIPSTFQQGMISDEEVPPHGELRVLTAARELHGLKAGILDAHQMKLSPEEIERELRVTRPKVVGLNPTSVNVREGRIIADICDRLGIPYILGGVEATLHPGIALEHFPNAYAAVCGSGEVVIGDLIRGIIRGEKPRIKGVYYLEQKQELLNQNNTIFTQADRLRPEQIPVSDQVLFVEQPNYHYTAVVFGNKVVLVEASLFTTTGCPFLCTFCDTPITSQHFVKGVQPYLHPGAGRLVDECERCITDLGSNAIHFMDDLAIATPRQVLDFHNELKNRDLLGTFVWRGLTRASILSRFTESQLHILKETGCWKLGLGVESGDEDMLKRIKKQITVDQVIRSIESLSREGILTKGFFIMGFPDETEEQIINTRKFILDLKNAGLSDVIISLYKPYPGTELYNELVSKRPEIVSQLEYLVRPGEDLSANSGIEFHPEAKETYFKDPHLCIARIPTSEVERYIVSTFNDFYRK